ncbi:MAG: aminoglycoside 6'-N-acetyltransferase [Bacteroidota bacterium]
MTQPITFITFQEKNFDALLKMSLKLWDDFKPSDLRKLLQQVSKANNQRIILAKNSKQVNIGFVIVSIRSDYVEGAKQSPTGYLEGIFVEQDYRKNGIVKKLVALGEEWLKAKGCTQIGSDTWISNTASRNFHKQLGFWEEEELVHFLKDIE